MFQPDARVVAAFQERYGYSEENATRAAAAMVQAAALGIERGGTVGFISTEGDEVRIEVFCIEEIV